MNLEMRSAHMGASVPEAPPPPVSAPDEDSMIVEDQLTHNFMPNPDRTTKGRVLRRSAKCEQKLEMILCSKLPMTLTSRFIRRLRLNDKSLFVRIVFFFEYGNLIGWGYR